MVEFRTASMVADRIEKLGYEVSRNVGKTGVVGVLRNGDGATVMLRADMDALPVTEATGLPYASQVKAKDEDGIEVGVAHACGHDLHVTWLLGAAQLLAKHRDAWKGTVLVVFQPGEEVGRGARIAAANVDRSRHHGRVDDHAAADHRVARNCAARQRGADSRRVAGGDKRKHHP